MIRWRTVHVAFLLLAILFHADFTETTIRRFSVWVIGTKYDLGFIHKSPLEENLQAKGLFIETLAAVRALVRFEVTAVQISDKGSLPSRRQRAKPQFLAPSQACQTSSRRKGLKPSDSTNLARGRPSRLGFVGVDAQHVLPAENREESGTLKLKTETCGDFFP
jgi:hypothetical protein